MCTFICICIHGYPYPYTCTYTDTYAYAYAYSCTGAYKEHLYIYLSIWNFPLLGSQ